MRRRRVRRWAVPSLAGALVAWAACGSEGAGGGPAPRPAEPEDASGTGGGGERPQKRTVMHRNPFGNVAATDNLLWDGDFEWRASFPDQYGWLSGAGNAVSYALPTLALGQRCRSGIKCAALPPGGHIVGLAVASKDEALSVGFWARPASGSCDDVTGLLSPTLLGGGASALIEPVDQTDAGWCRFEAVVEARAEAPFLLVRNTGGAEVVVDDAVIAPHEEEASGATPRARRRRRAPRWVSHPDMPAIRAAVRRATRPRRPPPTRGERILADKLERLRRRTP